MREALREAAAALSVPGGVVLYPTATLYGLGGRASDGAAARRIAAMKGRELLPLIVLVAEPPAGLRGRAAALAAALWPGPVTLIVPADAVSLPGGVAGEILARPEGRPPTLALRCTPHPLARALIRAAGPLTSTSANRHGEAPLLDPARCELPVDAILAGGPGRPGPPSTLVDTRDGAVLREGAALGAVRRALAAWGDGA